MRIESDKTISLLSLAATVEREREEIVTEKNQLPGILRFIFRGLDEVGMELNS